MAKAPTPRQMGPCAKTHVACHLVLPEGLGTIGTNWCRKPQAKCPRLPGEGYEKCQTVCEQPAHAEINAIRLAGGRADGATAYIVGHTYACEPCTLALKDAGVVAIVIGHPPAQ